MKKILLVVSISSSLLGYTSISNLNETFKLSSEEFDCQFGRCQQIKKDGYQCKNCAQENSSYCWSHRD